MTVAEKDRLYNYSGVMKEYNAAWKRIKTRKNISPGLDSKSCYKPRPNRRRTRSENRGIQRMEEVLEHALRLYKYDDLISPKTFSTQIGMCRSTVSSAITRLREIDMWPFRRLRKH